jgi:DNA-binding XRE family transcriptional regulator
MGDRTPVRYGALRPYRHVETSLTPWNGELVEAAKPFNLVVANNVRVERLRRRLRQSDIARALGVSPMTVGNMEGGKRFFSTSDLLVLCRVLGVDLRKLFAGADPDDLAALFGPEP